MGRLLTEHVDADNNGLCDVCGYVIDAKGEEKRLSAGAVIAISAGSATVLGAGGFSIFWFVIKKKKFSDLVALIKR